MEFQLSRIQPYIHYLSQDKAPLCSIHLLAQPYTLKFSILLDKKFFFSKAFENVLSQEDDEKDEISLALRTIMYKKYVSCRNPILNAFIINSFVHFLDEFQRPKSLPRRLHNALVKVLSSIHTDHIFASQV